MTDKVKGRPTKGKEKLKAYSLRIDDTMTSTLDKIAQVEKDKTGYNVDRSDIIRRALIEFIQRYESGAEDR